jgi:hypothetical protein
MGDERFRTKILVCHGASEKEIGELLDYNRNVFNHSLPLARQEFPLPDEPFVAVWREYAKEAERGGVFECLKKRLIQLHFPIRKGISQTDGYRAATLRGEPEECIPEATGLSLEHPEALSLMIHQTAAGGVPILTAGSHADFVALVRSLILKNEPGEVPVSMGAAMVAGYNNWDRIRRYRKQWELDHPDDILGQRWQEEFQRIIPQKELYQDQFILLSGGPYSAVSAKDMGLSHEEWKRTSLIIRQEHEAAHYFTRRLFSSMSNNLFDEILADYMGIAAAMGRYRAEWFLRFVGLESFPLYRQGGRLENYRGSPPLSDEAFRVLQSLVKAAAENLERLDMDHAEMLGTPMARTRMLMALTYLTLEDLASEEPGALIESFWSRLSAN